MDLTMHAATAAGDASTGARAHAAGARLRRWGARVAVLALAALLVSCSSLKLGYRYADTLLVYTLDSYLDLDDAQTEFARERVRALLEWHRASELAAYAELAAVAHRSLEAPVSAEDVLAFQQRMNAKVARLARRAVPDLALLALTLQPAQIDHLSRKLAADHAKARREWVKVTGRDTIDDRVRRYADRAQEWFGPLTQEQLAIVRAAVERRAALPQRPWLDERARREQELIAMLRRIAAEQPPVDEVNESLRRYVEALIEPSDPQRNAATAQTRHLNAQLVADLINAATPAQRSALAKRLRGYADDFTVLASEGGRG